ncbi:hypothetical protein JCM15548_14402 [Geofilum rubicundum JCM 15548]|uniref:Uncharacterized protein n=1 Tax=Geofilum rubicundum JCM 15548 TaxID=1236989 RepID=A0A0E9M2L0_9BACT|nr:hypothetical protein JCM15548_14402 [Geofilum rubicundum JCM 15548]
MRFNTQEGYIVFKPEEIAYLEADQVYTIIRTIDSRLHHVTVNIGKIEAMLERIVS